MWNVEINTHWFHSYLQNIHWNTHTCMNSPHRHIVLHSDKGWRHIHWYLTIKGFYIYVAGCYLWLIISISVTFPLRYIYYEAEGSFKMARYAVTVYIRIVFVNVNFENTTLCRHSMHTHCFRKIISESLLLCEMLK